MSNFQPTAQPQLRDILDRVKGDTSKSINCIQIGKIAAFNAAKNTVEVEIQSRRQMADGEVIDFPLLTDVPVFILSGGASHVSMPIEVDDPCIVLFNDRDIDTWWLSGKKDVPNSNRAHSIADGIALVGIRPQSDLITLGANPGVFSTDKKVSIKGVGAEVDGTSDKVYVKNAIHTLKDLVDGLITDLVGMSTLNCVNGSPTAFSVATINALNARKAQFDALLG